MMTDRTKYITLSAPFIAMGVLFPMLFHSVGLGPMFLPMFWPVVIGAFFLPIPYIVAVGILTPLLSSFMTGMPPPPVLYRMIFELGVLSIVLGYLYSRTRYGIFWLILSGLIFALFAGFVGSLIIAPLFGLPPEFYAAASLLNSVPGFLSMLVLLPVIVKRIKHETIFGLRKGDAKGS
jgi:hypothetical protein